MNRLPTTRYSLLRRLHDVNDSSAWQEFLNVYESAVYRYARSRGMQAADAEDITQTVLAVVHGKIGTWVHDRSEGSFGAWLFTVTRNLATKLWNERMQNPLKAVDWERNIDLDEIPEPKIDDVSIFDFQYRRALFHWAADRVRDAVQEQTWRAFWMTAIDGVEASEVATALDLTISSVYTAKCRVLSRIRNEIQKFENDLENSNDGRTK